MPLKIALPATVLLLWSGKLLAKVPTEFLTQAMATYAAVLVGWALLIRSRAWSGIAMGPWRPRLLMIGLATGLAALLASGVGYAVSQRMLALRPPAEATLIEGPGYRLLAGMAMAVAAAILEEWVFRGVTLSRLETLRGWSAAVVSAGLFASYHLSTFQLLPTFILGLFLAGIALATESIWTAVVAHVAYNLVGLILTAAGMGGGAAG